MIQFVNPSTDFEQSARQLSDGELIIQEMIVLGMLEQINGGCPGDSETRRWGSKSGYVEALVEWGCTIGTELRGRGFIAFDFCQNLMKKHSWGNEVELPPWLLPFREESDGENSSSRLP